MRAASYTLRSWLLTTDPRRIAILYLAALPLVGLAAFVPAALLQAGSLAPAGDLPEARSVELLGLGHGYGMVLLVLLPAIPAGLGLAVLGESPVPWLAPAGWYLWIIAGLVWLSGLLGGESEFRTTAMLAASSLGLTFLSLVLAARRRRPRGPFAWSILFAGAAWFVRLATGAPEPAVVAPLALVAALGVAAEVVRDCSGGALYGERLAPWLLGAVAAASFLPWGSRLLVEQPAPVVSGLLPFAILPPAALAAALLATVLRRPPAPAPALAFAWASIGLAIVCGGGFLLLASAPANMHLAGTAFEAAHLHFIAGAVLAAFVAGLHHWQGAIAGGAAPVGATSAAAPLLFGAWNLTFFPKFVAGYLGRPGGPGAHSDPFGVLDTISLLGTVGLGAVLGMAARDLVRSLFGHAPEAGGRPAASKMSE